MTVAAEANTLREMIGRAKAAQATWERSDQQRIDSVVREIARTVYDNAEELASLTVEETGLGNYEDNVRQDQRKAEIIWYSLKSKKSVGVIGRDEETGLVEIAKPVGVVGVALPVTIPVTNFMSNAMFSLKCGNAAIFAPHPKGARTIQRTLALALARLEPFDVPEHLIQVLPEPSIERTKELMSLVDVVVATGGMGVVKAAYSSGRPAYGVGPGNVPCIFDRGIDIDKAVEMAIQGRTFNNGLPCACEQAIIVPREDEGKAIASYVARGSAYVENSEDVDKLQAVLFDEDGVLNRECVGATAEAVAQRAGISIPTGAKMILAKGDLSDSRRTLRKEKLCPVSLLFTYQDFEEAVELAQSMLAIEGKGHSVAIHSENRRRIEQLSQSVPVSRVTVNQCCTTSAGGSFLNGFAPTTTLGCGTWGNNVISENLTYKHLMNVTRIGYAPKNARTPTSEEIWG